MKWCNLDVIFLFVSHLRLSQRIEDPGEGWLNHFNAITLNQQQPSGHNFFHYISGVTPPLTMKHIFPTSQRVFTHNLNIIKFSNSKIFHKQVDLFKQHCQPRIGKICLYLFFSLKNSSNTTYWLQVTEQKRCFRLTIL